MQRLLLLRACGTPETFDPFVKIEVRMRKGNTAHARVKKGAYHPRNTKIPSSRRIAFLRKKRHYANLRYVGNRFIPFSRRSARVTPDTIYSNTLNTSSNTLNTSSNTLNTSSNTLNTSGAIL